MANEELAEILHKLAFLLELKDENPFKIRALENSARILLEEAPLDELVASGKIKQISGFGKGSQTMAMEFLKLGTVNEFEEVKKEFPATIFELLDVRGLGPKKIKNLYQELEISSLTELEYACNENRLLDLKGFGEKTQQNILKGITEIKTNRGKVILPVAQQVAETVIEELQALRAKNILAVGQLRRALPVVEKLEFLAQNEVAFCKHQSDWESTQEHHYTKKSNGQIAVEVTFSEDNFAHHLLELTGPAEFVHRLKNSQGKTEEEIFSHAHQTYLPPETRDFGKILGKRLITEQDIRGVFHLHTTASDGANSLEEMVKGALAQGWEYLGISDHSQSAFYANGLKADRLQAQKREIQELQEKYPEIQIFHGIESDILANGELDYPEKILQAFDFVIASVHSQMKMDAETMTKRLCHALENPYTTWLGHWTGRLLLGRVGFTFDQEKVLRAAEKHGKGIELNCNPYRLDVDWQILPELVSRKISVGIFPDAHSAGGLADTKWGVLMARKAGLGPEHVVNTRTRKEMLSWLQNRK